MNEFPALRKYLDAMQWDIADKTWLINHWADAAVSTPVGGIAYFKGLMNNADLPDPFRRQVADVWKGDAKQDATNLYNWARKGGVNPKDAHYTTLASVIIPNIENVGAEQALKLASLIVKYRLIVSPKKADEFARRYQIPVIVAEAGHGEDIGPDFEWQGPKSDLELQGLFGSAPTEFDLKFISLAVIAGASVCRVEVDPGSGTGFTARGTGFLISPNLVLTNYHVLGETDEQVTAIAKQTRLRFGALTNFETGEDAGQVVPVAKALAMSPVANDDFVLLEADAAIGNCKGLVPVVLSSDPTPSDGEGLHILHHPGGSAMKLCISNNGVAKVLTDQRKIQYISKTLSGSSGAPCFNDQFHVVALHHAVRWKFGGAVGQGILIDTLRGILSKYL